MICVEFSSDLLSNLTRLLNTQLAAVPPGWSMTEAQTAQTIGLASNLWGVHYPEQKAVFKLETLCVLDRGRLAAAAQWGYPIPESTQGINRASVLFWVVAEPDSVEGTRLLLETITTRSRAAGSPKITTTRFSFGVGWLGIPGVWSHVSEALQAVGFNLTRRWVILTSAVKILGVRKPKILESMNISWQVNVNAAEWDLRLDADGKLAGECSAWGIPKHFLDCEGYYHWVMVEWLGVEPVYQRKGIGSWLMVEQFREQAQRGVTYAIMVTETDNQALLGLGKSLSFQVGPECWEFEKESNAKPR